MYLVQILYFKKDYTEKVLPFEIIQYTVDKIT